MYECNNSEEKPYLLPEIHLIFKDSQRKLITNTLEYDFDE